METMGGLPMMRTLMILLAMSVSPAAAVEYKFLNVRNIKQLHILRDHLKAAGIPVEQILCSKVECTIEITGKTTKDPGPIISAYSDPETPEEIMLRLAKKWQSETISPEEKEQLLKLFVLRFLGLR